MNKTVILLAVYNAEKFLRECLDSVVNQTFTDFRLIACDDGSKDSCLEILLEYAAKDPRITVLTNPVNMGIVATRNRLLKAVPEDAEFVAWIDDDDVCLPDRLERQTAFLAAHPEIGGVSSSLDIIDEDSRLVGFRRYPCDAAKIRRILPRTNVLAQPAMLLRKSIIRATGEYAAEYQGCEDYDFWLRASKYCDFANLPDPVLRYRISRNQFKQSKLKHSLRVTLAIQRAHFKRNGLPMPPAVLVKQLAGVVLLALPSRWIFRLFCFLAYKKPRNTE